MDDLHFINISERAYKYIRQFSIKSIEDALIELITNSIDAYKKTDIDEKKIEIEIINPNILIVRDHALGLDSDQLNRFFLQVGTYTASDTSRGFFSRGAKDISAIGDVYFTAIKDGKLSQCILNTDAHGAITIDNIQATDELKKTYKIPNNGLHVKLVLLPNYHNMMIDTIANNISKNCSLREILNNPKNIVTINDISNISNDADIANNNSQITYSHQESTTILELEYEIPKYKMYKATFVVKQVKQPFLQPMRENQMEFGFLMKDNTSVYEVNTIDNKFRWNPYINYLYGYLHCDGIHDLLIQYDNHGPTIENPYPVIDPSRISGLNMQHPFIIQLLSIPLVRLDLILRELNISKSTGSISIDELDDLLDELNKQGVTIIEENEINVNWKNNYDMNLAKAIQDDRMAYVTYEKSNTFVDPYEIKEITIRNYELPESKSISINTMDTNSIYVKNSNNELVQIPDITFTDIDGSPPINILKMLPTNIIDELQKQPYLYRMKPDGELEKLYMFDKGCLENNSELTNLKIRRKNFTITFINDLNMVERYTVDITQGINIKINLNNPIVKKYLSCEKNGFDDSVNISSISSSKSLIFMKELLIDVLSGIIVSNDVQNKKLTFETNSNDDYNNLRKILDYKNKITAKIEINIDKIFDKYISNTVDKNFNAISNIINDTNNDLNDENVKETILTTIHEILAI